MISMRRSLAWENARLLTWRTLVLMLVAHSAFAVVAQALVAVIFAFRFSATSSHDAEPVMAVYGALMTA